jgi:NAD(P)-dependent dehydrogenase (short-subunit alcohol dehydrogenase family)
MYGVQHAVRSMAHRNGGSIINIASMGGVGFESYDKPEYGAAKAGVMRLTASLAHLANDINVRVNCICPGLVDTPASRKGRAALSDAGRAAFDASPKLVPDDIADAVMMFLEDDALAGRVLLWNEGEPWHLVPRSAPY